MLVILRYINAKCCVHICCTFGKGHGPTAHLSDHQGLQFIGYWPYPMWAGKAWAVSLCVPLGQEWQCVL